MKVNALNSLIKSKTTPGNRKSFVRLATTLARIVLAQETINALHVASMVIAVQPITEFLNWVSAYAPWIQPK